MSMRFKFVTMGLCLISTVTMVVGCGSSVSSPTKVGEVASEASDAVAEKEDGKKEETSVEESTELKSQYHVGDVLKDKDLQIVYVASGEYIEDNEYMQPADGNKYVFITLAFENQGSSDSSVSSFSFEGYADGYSVDQHYSENDLSATLSPGRSTEGTIVFEVPKDAKDIEIEYEINLFTDEKIKFIYDGEKSSGYVLEANTNASENAFCVGDVVESDDLNISYLSCEKDISYSQFSEPESGSHYVTLTFEFENKGDSDAYVSMYEFDCYADGKDCEQSYFRDDGLSATISSGRKAKGTVTFLVPDDATVTEVEYVSNIWTSSRVVFAVSEE